MSKENNGGPAFPQTQTLDDLVMTTGLERKNLHDNVKATLKDELCQRIKDDVTDGWLRLAKEFECNNIPELRVFINAAVDKLDRLRSAKTDSLKNAHPEPAYSTDDAKPIYIIADNSSECVKLLRQFNEWRRFDGEIDEEGPAMPHPKSIGFAIDMAIRLIEELADMTEQVECSTIVKENMEGRLNILLVKYAAMKEQRDELLAALIELNSVSAHGFLYDDPARVKARAAIAKVQP